MLVGRELRPRTYSWGNAETILYALGVGAAPPRDLPLLFEGAGPLVLPTFGTVTTGIAFLDMIDELQIELGAILHGEQTIVLHRPLPPTGSVSIRRRVENVWDKGGGAVVVVEEEAVDDSPMFSSSSSWFVKGPGGSEVIAGRAPAAFRTHQTALRTFRFSARFELSRLHCID